MTRSAMMSRIGPKDTKPEIMVRKGLHRLGFRYRLHTKDLPGKPDIVLPKYRTVIFVHGCFWHGHEGCHYFRIPKTNTDFWQTKIGRNQERDAVVRQRLAQSGWRILTVWECATRQVLEDLLISVIADWLKGREKEASISEQDFFSRLDGKSGSRPK
ncbi:MAG: very short patch repair endonuclease [Pelagibaca sp.]|nr:very short patch repair endonuclease [Pelagibaca sp.]